MSAKQIALSEIRTDLGTQSRATIDQSVIDDYAEHLDALPPADVFFDGERYIMADGFYRHAAHRKEGKEAMPCTVHKGGVDDAKWFAAGANKTHGARRSNKDKENAVRLALSLPDGARKTDRDLASHCGVSPNTISKYRSELVSNAQIEHSETRVRSDGKTTAVASEKRSTAAKESAAAKKQTLRDSLHEDVAAAWDAGELELGQVKKLSALRPMLQVDELKKIRSKAAKKDKPKQKIHRADAPVHIERLCDATGADVPDELLPVFEALPKFSELGVALRNVIGKYESLIAEPAGHYLTKSDLNALKEIVERIAEAWPYAINPKNKCGFSSVGSSKK